jgi:hypothetical protein
MMPVNIEAVSKLTPAQVRIIGLLKKHRVPGTGRVTWPAICLECHWPHAVVRQQVQFALNAVGAADVDELVRKYDLYLAAKTGDYVG